MTMSNELVLLGVIDRCLLHGFSFYYSHSFRSSQSMFFSSSASSTLWYLSDILEMGFPTCFLQTQAGVSQGPFSNQDLICICNKRKKTHKQFRAEVTHNFVNSNGHTKNLTAVQPICHFTFRDRYEFKNVQKSQKHAAASCFPFAPSRPS